MPKIWGNKTKNVKKDKTSNPINPATIVVGLIAQHMDVLPMAESHRESMKIKGFHTTPPDFSGR